MMRQDGRYIDTSNLPTTIHEYFNLMTAQRDKFNALPVAIKEKFGNSFEVWASTSGTSEWLEKMGIQGPAPEPKKEMSDKKEVGDENGES